MYAKCKKHVCKISQDWQYYFITYVSLYYYFIVYSIHELINVKI